MRSRRIGRRVGEEGEGMRLGIIGIGRGGGEGSSPKGWRK